MSAVPVTVLKLRRYRTTAFDIYADRLVGEVIRILVNSCENGEEIFQCLNIEMDNTWQVPAIEAPESKKSVSGSPMQDICPSLSTSALQVDRFMEKWEQVAKPMRLNPSVIAKFQGLSYAGFAEMLGVSSPQANLLFACHDPDSAGSRAQCATFALETAAYLSTTYDMPFVRGDVDYYTVYQDKPIGVKGGTVYLGEPTPYAVDQGLLNMTLRLPRGRLFKILTRDTVDCIRGWLEEHECEESEHLLDCLAILKLGEAHRAFTDLNMRVLALAKEIKHAKAKLDFDAGRSNKLVRLMRKRITAAQMQEDFVSAQEVMGDNTTVDRAKMASLLEILVPRYMALNSFKRNIGYLTREGSTGAMFDKHKYDKMVKGWERFRDRKLAAIPGEIEQKLEHRP